MPLDQPHKDEQASMPFGDHLEELRRRLIHALIGIALCVVIMLYFGRDLVVIIQLPLIEVMRQLGLPQTTYAFGPITGFAVYLKVSIIAGLIVSAPWAVYQIWKFVSAGLYASERFVAYVLAPFSTGMMVLGVMFSYFIMLPVCMLFLIGFAMRYPPPGEGPQFTRWLTDRMKSALVDEVREPAAHMVDGRTQIPLLIEDPAAPLQGETWIKLPERQLRMRLGDQNVILAHAQSTGGIDPLIGITEYISFALTITLGIVIGFQLPVVMLILGWTALVDPRIVRPYRKHALLGCFVIGALLTPSDPVSMFLLAVPLYALFELGLILMRLVYRSPGQGGPTLDSGTI